MKWYRADELLPPEWEDVLVCFDVNNPNSCAVLAYNPEGYPEPEWWSIDATYQVLPNDWWAKIELPKE